MGTEHDTGQSNGDYWWPKSFKCDNRCLVDIRHVRYADFCWVSDRTYSQNAKPKGPTVNGQLIDPLEKALPHPDYPGELLLDRAKRLDLLDIWHPVCVMELSAHRHLVFRGHKALNMWELWKAKIYGNKKKLSA